MVQMKKFTLGDDWIPKKLGMTIFLVNIKKIARLLVQNRVSVTR